MNVLCTNCEKEFDESLIVERWERDALGDPVELHEYCPYCNGENLEDVEDNLLSNPL